MEGPACHAIIMMPRDITTYCLPSADELPLKFEPPQLLATHPKLATKLPACTARRGDGTKEEGVGRAASFDRRSSPWRGRVVLMPTESRG